MRLGERKEEIMSQLDPPFKYGLLDVMDADIKDRMERLSPEVQEKVIKELKDRGHKTHDIMDMLFRK